MTSRSSAGADLLRAGAEMGVWLIDDCLAGLTRRLKRQDINRSGPEGWSREAGTEELYGYRFLCLGCDSRRRAASIER
jgi:hypothetical protein